LISGDSEEDVEEANDVRLPVRPWFRLPQEDLTEWFKIYLISQIEPKLPLEKPARCPKLQILCHPKMFEVLFPPGQQSQILDTPSLILDFFGRELKREHTPGSPTSTITTVAPLVTFSYKPPFTLTCTYNCTAYVRTGAKRW